MGGCVCRAGFRIACLRDAPPQLIVGVGSHDTSRVGHQQGFTTPIVSVGRNEIEPSSVYGCSLQLPPAVKRKIGAVAIGIGDVDLLTFAIIGITRLEIEPCGIDRARQNTIGTVIGIGNLIAVGVSCFNEVVGGIVIALGRRAEDFVCALASNDFQIAVFVVLVAGDIAQRISDAIGLPMLVVDSLKRQPFGGGNGD